MKELIAESAFFGMLLTLACYQFGCFLQRKFPIALCNPLLISILLCIGLLLLLNIPYDSYAAGKSLSQMQSPEFLIQLNNGGAVWLQSGD